MTALTQYTALEVTGEDNESFLQGLLTCDVNASPPVLGALCTPKGRAITHFWLEKDDHNIYLIVPNTLLETLMHTLSRYIFRSKVSLSPSRRSVHAHCKDVPYATLNSSAGSLTDSEFNDALIEAGIATLTTSSSEQYTPHMLNYPAIGAVSFTKGCFLGQEIIARTEHLGKSKRTLKRLSLDELEQRQIKDNDILAQNTQFALVVVSDT